MQFASRLEALFVKGARSEAKRSLIHTDYSSANLFHLVFRRARSLIVSTRI